MERLTRRTALARAAGATIGAAASLTPATAATGEVRKQQRRDTERRPAFRFCLNTSTLRGQKLPLDQLAQTAATAGYDAIEPWLSEIEAYEKAGGSLDDLRKRIADLGLAVPSAIGFAAWIVDDAAQRAQGLEQAKRDMERVRRIGGTRIAAPPAGATDRTGMDLLAAAERYRALLEAGKSIGVIPQVEVWGFSKTLSRLGETALVAIESGHPDACILADVYHLHKGGSSWAGLSLLEGARMHVFHVNDYPADPPRETIQDQHRIYPGDGVAPLADILRSLRQGGFSGYLSLELFNRDYWQQEPTGVAKTGLQKMKNTVKRAG